MRRDAAVAKVAPCDPRRRREGGFSLIEMSIGMVITVVILQIAVSSTLVLNQSTHLGNKRVYLITKAELCLRKFHYELSRSSSGIDPATDLPYMNIHGEEGDRRITFRRVVDFAEKEGEVIPIWSTDITFRLDGENVLREQDGREALLLRGVTELEFQLDPAGAVEVGIAVMDLSPGSAQQAARRASKIHPAF